jgi:acyl dehydratase
MMMAVTRETYLNMVGREIGTSSWRVVDQQRIDAFADVTTDHQFIHVDRDRAAKETPFGTTIAHGFLSLSLLSAFAYEVLPPLREAG